MNSSNNYFQLIAEFQKNIDWLNKVLKGNSLETINVDGVIKPTISKAISDEFGALQAMVQGRLAYKTKSVMDAAGAPPSGTVLAEVWKDSTVDNNGLYGWSGTAWEKSPMSSYGMLRNEFTQGDLWLGVPFETDEKDKNFSGEANNGAEWIAGGFNSSLGWRIPVGSTGSTTYNRYGFNFDAGFIAQNKGQMIEVVHVLESSSNITQYIKFGYGANINGVSASPDIDFIQTYENQILLRVRFQLDGTETSLGAYLQVSQNLDRTREHTLTPKGIFISVRSPGSGLQQVKRIVDETNAKNSPSLELLDTAYLVGLIGNGASFHNGRNGVIVPDGQTGATSYTDHQIDIKPFAKYPGCKVRVTLEAETSTDFFKTVGISKNFNLRKVDASLVTAVAKNITYTSDGPNHLKFTGEYTIEKDDSTLSPYLQISSSVTTGIRYFSVTRCRVEILDTGDFALEPSELRDILFMEYRQTPASLGVVFDGDLLTRTTGQGINGGELTKYGFKIPAGQVGTSTYQRWHIKNGWFSDFIGQYVRVRFKVKIDGDHSMFGLSYGVDEYNPSWTSQAEVQFTRWLRDKSDGEYWFESLYQIKEDVVDFGGFIQLTGNVQPVTEEVELSLLAVEVMPCWLGLHNTDKNRNDANQALHLKVLDDSRTVDDNVEYYRTITVAEDGSGDFTTVKAAAASIVDSGKYRRYLISVKPGIYTDVDYHIPNYVDLIGESWKNTWIKGYLPPETSRETIVNTETIWMNYTSKFKNLRITCQNMRYPIHSDSGPSGNQAIQELEDLWIQHLGNDEADAHHGYPVWSSQHAWGCGTHSNQKIYSRRCRWESASSAFYYHTNRDFAKPCHVELENSEMIVTKEGGYGLVLAPLGSGAPDTCVVNGCVIGGAGINIIDPPWLGTDQPSDHCEIELRISASTSVPVNISTTTAGLLLAGGSENIQVSGSAVPVIFGIVTYRDGAPNLPPIAMGSLDVFGHWQASAKLAQRLGNRVSDPLTLRVDLDGGSTSKSIVFDRDYSADSLADIIAEMNTEFGGVATIDYENFSYWYRPVFADEEETLSNSGTDGIKRGQALVKTSYSSCKVMTKSDDAALFAGIALQDILPGRGGRVRTKGVINYLWANVVGGPEFGDKLVVGDVPGQLVIDNSAGSYIAKGVGRSASIRAIELKGE